MVILTQMDAFNVFCKILLSRTHFEINVICNTVQDIPRITESYMFRDLKGVEDSDTLE